MNEEKVEEDIHEEDYEVEFEEVDEEIQKIPKLNLNRLMSARSTCSVKRKWFESSIVDDSWMIDSWTRSKPNIFKINQE